MFLDKVESLNVNQGIFGRLLDYGTVTIVGTEATKEPICSVLAPMTLRRRLMEAADGYRRKKVRCWVVPLPRPYFPNAISGDAQGSGEINGSVCMRFATI